MSENKRRLFPVVAGLALAGGAFELMRSTDSAQTESTSAQPSDSTLKKPVSHDLEKRSRRQTLEQTSAKHGLHDKIIGQEHHIFTDQDVEVLTVTCQVDGSCTATLSSALQALSKHSDLALIPRQPTVKGVENFDTVFNSVLALDELRYQLDELIYSYPESDTLSPEQIADAAVAQRDFVQQLDAALQASPFFMLDYTTPQSEAITNKD